MTATTKITVIMRSVLQKGASPNMESVSLRPALRVQFGVGGHFAEIVATIDTGAEISILDRSIFVKHFGEHPPTSFREVMAVGFSKQRVQLHDLNLRLLGDETEELITIENAPIAIMDLGRPMMVLGFRGVLEWLEVNVDYPHRRVTLQRATQSSTQFPALAQEFPSFANVTEMVNSGQNAAAIMTLAWDMERYIDSLAAENVSLSNSLQKLSRNQRTLGRLLDVTCSQLNANDILDYARVFTNARNTAAHAMTDITSQTVSAALEAADRIVARLKGEHITKRWA